MRARAERRHLGALERPEAGRVGDLRRVGDRLIAEQQHRMGLECGAHRPVERRLRGDLGQRDAAQLGRETRSDGQDLHRASSSGEFRRRRRPHSSVQTAGNPARFSGVGLPG